MTDDRDPVSDIAAQAVFMAAGRRCECVDPQCNEGHHGRCLRSFRFQDRGASTANDKWQLDHIDGDPNNNDPGNLQVLCSACYRSKSVGPRR